jgi:hypothetical protein
MRPEPYARTTLTLATAAAAIALVSALGLSALARPQDLKARLAVVEDEVARAERHASAPGEAGAFPAGAVCAAPGPGADALKRRIETDAAAASVSIGALSVDVPTPDADSAAVASASPLTAVRLQLQVNGKYEAVAAMLGALDSGGPVIFVDSADLKPQSGGAASLKLTGRVLCWAQQGR